MKKKWIDERGLLFGKISVVDILAVLMVAALGLMVYVRFFSGGDGSVALDNETQVEYTVKIAGVRSMTYDALAEGDRIFNEDGGAMGEITGKRSEPHVEKTPTLDGRVADMVKEGYYDVYITVRANCSVSSGRYYVGGTYELSVNASLPFVTRYVSTTGVIDSIN